MAAYSKTTWLTGDLITQAKANNWETQYDDAKAEYQAGNWRATAAYKARGTATIASAGNSIVVTHGMVTTPTKIVVTGSTADTAALYVDTIGATYFTIHSVEIVADARTVYWYAEV